GTILLITLFFAYQVPAVRLVSEFSDLLPQEHPYIQTHNEIRETFGGANNVVVVLEVKRGDIFNPETLNKIHRITQKVDSLSGINHNLVTSLTHRTTRRVWLNEFGTLKSAEYFDPLQKEYTQQQLDKLKEDVLSNPRVYGLLVSPDLSSALIRGTLNEGELDYQKVFSELQELRDSENEEGINIYATGQPVLVGWVTSYVGEILEIFLFTILIMVCLLILYFRKFYGVLLPVIGIILTTIWGLGIIALLGYNLDPLMMVVPFLISARAMSHGIQLIERFYHESQNNDKQTAARNTFEGLFRPGSLGVISDAIGLLLIALGSVPINDKLAVYASLWAGSVIFTVLIFIPVLLSVLPDPKNTEIKHNFLRKLLPTVSKISCTPKGSGYTLITVVVLFAVSLFFCSKVQIGEADPGSPLLYPDHDYNISSTAINNLYPGSEELFIVAHSDKEHGLKQPEIIRALADFQQQMMLDPELGGTKGLPDLILQVNKIIHGGDPRWLAFPKDEFESGGLMFTYMMSSPVPGALLEFIDADEQNANMVFYYKDHKGETIRRAIYMVKRWMASSAAQIEGFSLKLAGGVIGVTAAINEAAYETNIVVIPLVFLLILVFVTAFYWSIHAGWLMLLAMSFATTLTYAYMGIVGMGINVNTVPVIAVGIGIGIDYSIYIMDRIIAEMKNLGDLQKAIEKAISTTGVAIGFTAITLISGIVMWVFISTMRFQADAALLLIVMLVLNALAAMFIVPAWIMRFKPRFIMG
ncbi:MAG TPA: transporter, partial [Gammaproteobacteria bacterium]|nr:transporter [Gammaproteobacteria bacterium]